MSLFKKKTKIVATLGPSTSSEETLYEMMKNGVNVFRVNFSHANHENVAKIIKTIREINKREGWNVAILGDLQGPKLRVGKVKEGSFLNPGDTFTFTNEKIEGDSTQAYMSYERFPLDVKVGEQVLVDDGKLILKVLETNGKDTVTTKVIQGGPIKSNKGVNLPNTGLSVPALTEKDREDALFAMNQKVDWFALSFVRNSEDIQILRDFIKENTHEDYEIPIISKIEKPEAISDIDEIINASDGIMVARGDLGVEMPLEELPILQKSIVLKCKEQKIPVIIATQMLETMTNSLTPTRAEVSDVANAVFDGADAVMLSGETSVGDYPVEVIQQMAKILKKVELNENIKVPDVFPTDKGQGRYVTNIVCYEAAKTAKKIGAQCIITLTYSGYTAFEISGHRPNCYTLVFTNNERILPKLNLLWGVHAFLYERFVSTDETIKEINRIVIESGFAKNEDFVVNLSSMPVEAKGQVNTIRVSKI